MDTYAFKNIFEQHVSAEQVNVGTLPNYLVHPQLSVYSVVRYDGTMGVAHVGLPAMYQPLKQVTARDFGKQFIIGNVLRNQKPGAVFLTQRMFYDTEKVKGNQVLQIFGLSVSGETCETTIALTEKQKAVSFSPNNIVLFGIKQNKPEFKILREFFAGLQVIAPQIISITDFLSPAALIERVTQMHV